MKECIYDIKMLSNMIVVRFAEDDVFMNILKSHIAKNFSSTMNMRHSTFIFNRENETLKRKIFLTWMHNLYQKSGKATQRYLLDKILESQGLTICLQVVPKAKVVETSRVFAYFFGNKILFRTDDKQSPIFTYFNALFRNSGLGITYSGVNFHVDMSGADFYWLQKTKKLFAQRLSIGGKNFNLIYNATDFDTFFARFGAHAHHGDFSFKFGGFNHQKAVQNDFETMNDEQKRASYLSMLGCSSGDDIKTIKRRYLTLAKEYHPDMHHGKDARTVRSLTDKFIQVKSAYDFIINSGAEERMCA